MHAWANLAQGVKMANQTKWRNLKAAAIFAGAACLSYVALASLFRVGCMVGGHSNTEEIAGFSATAILSVAIAAMTAFWYRKPQ